MAQSTCEIENATITQISTLRCEKREDEDGQHRAADGDADGIGADQQAGRRNGDAKVAGERRQDARNDELCRADGEGGERQGIDGERHGNPRA